MSAGGKRVLWSVLGGIVGLAAFMAPAPPNWMADLAGPVVIFCGSYLMTYLLVRVVGD